MNLEQKEAVSCAYYDLIGALEAHQKGMLDQQDWKAIWFSINDLYSAFRDDFKDAEEEMTPPDSIVTKPEN
jgi:hypothetical protein